MGRMLEILRQDRPSSRAGDAPHTFTTDWAPSADKAPHTPHEEAEIPFIEVGAHKWMEASPGVLATATLPARETVLNRAARPENEGGPQALPRRAEIRRCEPKKVSLREIKAGGPAARYASDLVAFQAPDHPVSKQYRALAEHMMARQDQPQLILLTAARGEAGTTTTLLNLAAGAVSLGRSVLVVDANLRRPGIAERLGLPEAPGLRELLAATVALDQAVRSTWLPNLHIVPSGVKPAVTVPGVAPDPMRTLLAQLRERFDLVFVDGPSWDGRPEIVALGTACDAVYLVLPEAEAEAHEAAALCQLIPEQGASLAGCILSRY